MHCTAARTVLEGCKKELLAQLPLLGPAFIASVAYVDRGNYTTNVTSGSAFQCLLLATKTTFRIAGEGAAVLNED